MKRFLTSVAIAILCGALVTPVIEARDGRRPSSGQSAGRPSSGGGRGNQARTPVTSPGGNSHSGSRPGGSWRPDNHNKPDNPGRPAGGNQWDHGGNHGKPDRPGNPGWNKPGNNPGWNGSGRPGNNGGNRPGQPNPPSDRHPGGPVHNPGHHHGPATPPPGRPLPPPKPWSAPRPPRGWRPAPMAPRFSTVLGITFGSAINVSLNFLVSNGYSVYSYGDDVVYLNNVNQLNYLWPSAALYYGTAGLSRGEFIYSTSYYDTSRYNSVYSSLTAAYGSPAGMTAITNGMQTTWFGYDGRFVTLQYQPQYGSDGIIRYYTTLTFGY